MPKKSPRKLSLRKETLRQLDESELGAVAGGTYSEFVMLRQPSQTLSTSCTSFGCMDFNYNIYYW
jgi:hypothetical protein